MLYEIVRMIFDKAKEKKVDVLAARDMCISDAPERSEEILAAYKKASPYYHQLTAFNRESKPECVEELCDLIEADDKNGINTFLKHYENFLKESFEKAKK